MAVTRYKDVEDTSSSIYAQGDPYDPVLDFGRYIDDNDTIVDTDLIAWVTTGMYHIPQPEDVPSSPTTGKYNWKMFILLPNKTEKIMIFMLSL